MQKSKVQRNRQIYKNPKRVKLGKGWNGGTMTNWQTMRGTHQLKYMREANKTQVKQIGAINKGGKRTMT